jgi:hypothetical protein
VGAICDTISFVVSDYNCVARALTVDEYEELAARALPSSQLFNTEDKEKIILSCLQEPKELIDLIIDGSIIYGIPELVFESILQLSGFSITKEEREETLNEIRDFIKTDVVSSCKIMIIASGLMNLEQIGKLTFLQLLERVALAEEVLFIQQQNTIAAMSGGEPLKLMWDVVDSSTAQIQQIHDSKQNEVQALLDEQTTMRGGPGIRRL